MTAGVTVAGNKDSETVNAAATVYWLLEREKPAGSLDRWQEPGGRLPIERQRREQQVAATSLPNFCRSHNFVTLLLMMAARKQLILILSLSLLLILSVHGSIYDDCSGSEVLCIGSSGNAPSVAGHGGCMDGNDCQVVLVIKGNAGRYDIKFAAEKGKAVLVRSLIMTENHNLYKDHMLAIPDNQLFLEGMSVTNEELDNSVLIKYKELPNPSCLRSGGEGCSDTSENMDGAHHYETGQPSTDGDMHVFPFTSSSKILFRPSPLFQILDGNDNDADYNVHLLTDMIVIAVYHIVSDWEGKYPSFNESKSSLVNLIETKPFKLFRDVPKFIIPGDHRSHDLTWLWILMAFALLVLIVLGASYCIRKRREDQDGHVALGTRSNVPSLRSSVPMNPSNRYSGLGSDQRSSMPSQQSSGHEAHKLHGHPSSLTKSSPFSATPSGNRISTAAASLGPSASSSPASSGIKQASSKPGTLSNPASSSQPKPSTLKAGSSNRKNSNPELNQGLSSF